MNFYIILGLIVCYYGGIVRDIEGVRCIMELLRKNSSVFEYLGFREVGVIYYKISLL